MINDDGNKLKEDIVLFIKREAARETQGTIAGQINARHLPRKLVDGAQGAQISAHELEAAVPALEKITDATMRRTVQSYFMITTKYQALNMLINPKNRLNQIQPEVVAELINVVTKADRKKLGKARQTLGSV